MLKYIKNKEKVLDEMSKIKGLEAVVKHQKEALDKIKNSLNRLKISSSEYEG